LLVVGIHKELQAVAGFVAVKPQVDRIATGHAIFVKLLITLRLLVYTIMITSSGPEAAYLP